MKYPFTIRLATLGLILACVLSGHHLHGAETAPRALPFDRETVSRLSVDGRPRSMAIRQGADVWLGYDLERATVFKVWQAPAGKPGLIKTDFATKSAGTAWFEDNSTAQWELRRGGKTVPLAIRYLGCSQRKDHLELQWELRHDAGLLVLRERIPLAAAPAADRIVRELLVESLADGEALLPPSTGRDAWKPASGPTLAPLVLTGTEWNRLTLP